MAADAAESPARVAPADYLATERRALEQRSELWEGEAFAMVGASWAHNVVGANLVTALNNGLRGTPCRAVGSDLKVHVPRKQGFVYPDVVVVCEPRFHDEHHDVVENPVLVAEVLSPSTERFDRGEKFDGYRSIPSVEQILLVSQSTPRVEHYVRLDDESWRLRVVEGEGSVDLSPLDVRLPLALLYEGSEPER